LCWGAGSLAKGHREFAVPFSFFRKTSAGRRETSVRIDLNADVGEAQPGGARAAEVAILPYLTSVNIACGGHAGDDDSMHELVEAARAAGVSIGAHPGYHDREGMGRRSQHLPASEVTALVCAQIARLAEIAATHCVTLTHVKPHGALYNQAAADRVLASAIAEGVRQFGDELWLVALAGSRLAEAGETLGLRVAQEAFADRAYRHDGSLMPRTEQGAVHEHADRVIAQALSIAIRHRIQLPDGRTLPIDADTLCLHGDTPGAAELGREIRLAFAEAGVDVRPFGATR
jgi:UPF0271 protein